MARKWFPDTAAEVGTPVAWQFSVRTVFNIKILSVLSIRIFAGFFEPFVLIRAVIDDEIHQDVHIAFLGLSNQTVHIVHGTEARVDIIIIGNIVALICERRAVDRREPDNVDTEVFEVIEFADNARKITNAVSVRITEAFWVDLIGCFFVPPFFLHSKNSFHYYKIVIKSVCYREKFLPYFAVGTAAV